MLMCDMLCIYVPIGYEKTIEKFIKKYDGKINLSSRIAFIDTSLIKDLQKFRDDLDILIFKKDPDSILPRNFCDFIEKRFLERD